MQVSLLIFQLSIQQSRLIVPLIIPTRGTADIGLVDLRATNVLVNAPMAADQGFRVVQSRFLNEASVEASPVDVFSSNIVTIVTPATPVEVGAQVLTPSERAFVDSTSVRMLLQLT